jgi:hypothetical protein
MSRKRWVLAIVIALLCVTSLWRPTSLQPPDEREGVRSVVSVMPPREVASIPEPSQDALREAALDFVATREVVSVRLDDGYTPTVHATVVGLSAGFDALAAVPEALADDPGLAVLLEEGFELSALRDPAHLASLVDAGFGVDGDAWQADPWSAVVGLEVVWQQAAAAQRDAMIADLKGPEPWRRPEEALPEFVALAERVEAVLERWPDHPAAHHARVYGVEAEQAQPTPNRGAVWAYVQPLLEDDATAELAVMALEHALSLSAPGALTARDWQQIGAWHDAHGDVGGVPMVLVDAGSLQAMEGPTASAWLDRRDESIRVACSPAPEHCAAFHEESDRRRAYLSRASAGAAHSRRTALESLIWTCDDQHRVEAYTLGAATWDEGWVWTELRPAGPFADCLRSGGVLGPAPAEGLQVLVEAVPPGEPARLTFLRTLADARQR